MTTPRNIAVAFGALLIFAVGYVFFSLPDVPKDIRYGASFSAAYAEELGLNWREVYVAMLDELGVRDIRIPVYWDRVEAQRDVYDWVETDYMLRVAAKRDARVVLVLGRRVPRWPECHVPSWAEAEPWDVQKEELREFLREAVARYQENPAIEYWQVENEAYLTVFATEHCGELDEEFLKEEIALVRSLDERPILVTDSGNLGLWWKPYSHGDAFGTSLYMYFWTPNFGQYKTRLPAVYYRAKERVMQIVHGKKPAFLIELSLEPWLTQPIKDTGIDVQLSRMDKEKFDEIIEYASRTGFERQYLWGLEWWYYMRERNHPEFWDAAAKLYANE